MDTIINMLYKLEIEPDEKRSLTDLLEWLYLQQNGTELIMGNHNKVFRLPPVEYEKYSNLVHEMEGPSHIKLLQYKMILVEEDPSADQVITLLSVSTSSSFL